MGILKQNRCSSKSAAKTSASKSSLSVFRLFLVGGNSCHGANGLRTAAKDAPPTDEEAAADGRTASKDDCSSVSNHVNSNNLPVYTPEVALSPDALPVSEVPLCHKPMDAQHNTVGNSAAAGGGGGGGAEADAHASAMARYDAWQRQRRPHFRFGPRRQADEDEDGGGDSSDRQQGSAGGSSVSSQSAGDPDVITGPSKFAFIYQDGKFVEREVTNWPKLQRLLPHMRYRVMEPYASSYGRHYRKRISQQEHLISVRHRLIYQSPILRLPRQIMEENKSRLMIRHSLKDRFEASGTPPTAGPQAVDIGERVLFKKFKEDFENQNIKDAEYLVDYMTKSRKR